MYLVTGATGGIGRRVVRLLRERELPVRAFVRLTSRYGELD
ncbi:MAG: NAD(P)H-binding protein, partial [Coleofasciculus sp. S288]|nr:NAD(P)H-binding protein [Coleofasciculus sp. S288]